jgi:hypothetical protein
LLAALCACSAPSAGDKGSGVAGVRFDPYPSQSLEGIVYIKARLPHEHAELFKVDLIDKYGIVPVAVTLCLRGKDKLHDQENAQIRLDAAQANPRLFLQDGTALAPIDVETLAKMLGEKAADRVQGRALAPGLLDKQEKAQERFLFFRLAPSKEFEVDGVRLVHTAGKVAREVDLSRSLLALDVTVDERAQPLFVGLGG